MGTIPAQDAIENLDLKLNQVQALAFALGALLEVESSAHYLADMIYDLVADGADISSLKRMVGAGG